MLQSIAALLPGLRGPVAAILLAGAAQFGAPPALAQVPDAGPGTNGAGLRGDHPDAPGSERPGIGLAPAGANRAGGSAAAANEAYLNARRLYRAGDAGAALTAADAALTRHPRDLQLRFLRGVLQTELKRPAEAAKTFEALAEDFPEIPELHNNLAVIYAAGGELDKARAALESALRALPDYSTARENLGDIYLRLALREYDRAGKLAPASKSVQGKLTLAREMIQKTLPTPDNRQ
jgi:tetratricopeptide (TPR) repeat protein